jgi:hypothetical protein
MPLHTPEATEKRNHARQNHMAAPHRIIHTPPKLHKQQQQVRRFRLHSIQRRGVNTRAALEKAPRNSNMPALSGGGEEARELLAAVRRFAFEE